MTPFPYQIEGAHFLAEHTSALLADDMGLGKSAQAIMACDTLLARHVLVICPASVRENWRREFVKFSKSGIKPIVASYDAASRGFMAEGELDVLILDEAHYLKTRDSKRTKAIFGPKCDGVGGLVERAKRTFLLTGTPAPNNAAELWPMLRACAPDTIATATGRPMSYWGFVSRYCRTRDNGFGLTIVGGKNLGVLREKMAPFVLRRKKEEVLKDLPPIRFDTLAVEGKLHLPQDCAEEVRLLYKTMEEKGIEGLREIAPHVAQLRRLTGLAKVAPCADWIEDWVLGGDGKLVVCAHHRDVMHGLISRLEHANIGYTGMDGSHSSLDRKNRMDAFQDRPEIRVFIGQIQTMIGITLTAASDALFVESSWVPAENEQAAMRIHRIGQQNACMVRFAMLAGSIDEDIQRAVLRKTKDISALFT